MSITALEVKCPVCGRVNTPSEMRIDQDWQPVLYPNAVYSLIRNGWYIDLFKIGKLNHAAPPAEIIKAGGWAAFGEEAERLCREHGRAYYIKEDLRAEMEKARET